MTIKKTTPPRSNNKKNTEPTGNVKASGNDENKSSIMTKKDLLNRVKEGATGVNGQIVSSVVDIVLLEIGNAIRAEKTIKAFPSGNLIVQKKKTLEDGEVIICKLRIKSAPEQSRDVG